MASLSPGRSSFKALRRLCRSPRAPQRRACSRRPLLEQLEDRRLLAFNLKIVADFGLPTDSGYITDDPGTPGAIARSTIGTAISAYNASFSSNFNFTVKINFLDDQSIPGAKSSPSKFQSTYSKYRNALDTQQTKSADDTTALDPNIGSLPPVLANPGTRFDGDPIVELQAANAIALGLDTAAEADGEIRLNLKLFNLDRNPPQNSQEPDLLAAVCHEIDEILGFGSALNNLNNGELVPATNNLMPDDFFRFGPPPVIGQPGARSLDTNLATLAFFSIDGGRTDLAQFNQSSPITSPLTFPDLSDWFSKNPPSVPSTPYPPRVQDAFISGGWAPNLGLELMRLDVLGYTRVDTHAPVLTALSDQTVDEGASMSFKLGRLTDPDTGPWTVTVSWGDPSSSSSDTFFVNTAADSLLTWPHTYTEESPIGQSYVVTVKVTDFTGQSDSKTFNVSVSDPPLTNVTGVSFSAVEGAGTYEVATFTDPGNINGVHHEIYTASIDWGDFPGSTSAGTISYDGNQGVYTVWGAHPYSEEGTFSVHVTIKHESLAPVSPTVMGMATVSDPAVTAVAGIGPLVMNGSFEAVPIGVLSNFESGFDSPANFPGWHTGKTGGDGPLWNDGFGGHGPRWEISAGDGHQFVTMGGGPFHTGFSAWDQKVSGFIPGHTYTLTFQMASEGDAAGSQSITFSILNDPNVTYLTPQTVAAPASADYWRNWVPQKTTFIPTNLSGIEDIQFSATTQYDVGLDDVRVTDDAPFVFTAVEGAHSTTQTVATFEDLGGPEPNNFAHYTADIDWGDTPNHGSTKGAITFNPATMVFSVQGDHTYLEEGNYTITVTIHHESAPDAIVTLPAVVTDPPVEAVYFPILDAVEGKVLQDVVIATFTDPGDPDGLEPLTDYSAFINWPDGNPTQVTIKPRDKDGVYTVLFSHTCGEEGDYFAPPFSGSGILIINHGSAPSTAVGDLIHVSDAAVCATGLDVPVVEGSPFFASPERPVATFTDPGGSEPITDASGVDNYTADVFWDNNALLGATITGPDDNGVYTVHANHFYREEGTYPFTVTIHHGGIDVTVTSHAVVSDPPVSVNYSLTTSAIITIPGSPPGVWIASFTTFTDPGGPEAIDDYAATIEWADHMKSPGLILGPNINGMFSVSGAHHYATAALLDAPVMVTITHENKDELSTTVTSTSPFSFGGGLTFPILMKFPSPVTVTGTPSLKLNSGGTATYSSGSGSDILTFLYTPGAGNFSPRLDYTSTHALTLNGGTMTDASGQPVNLTLPAPGSPGSLGASTKISVDAVAPTVLEYDVLFGSKRYNLIGSSRFDLPWKITGIRVVFSKPIAAGDVASLTGLSATRLTGLGTKTLTWTFAPLVLGQFATTLFGTGPHALKDALGNPLSDGAGFQQNFRVLYGDDTDDGVVTSADLGAIYAATASPYDIFADLNGDGKVDILDAQAVRRRFGTRVS